MKVLIQHVGIIIDALYKNYSKEKFEQLSLKEIAAKLSLSVTPVAKVRNILSQRKVLVIDGARRSQTCYWNPSRCKPNEHLLLDVYKAYTKDAKSRVKVNEKKSKRLSSIEQALLILKKEGWAKVKLGKVYAGTIIEHTIDLSGVGE